MKKNSDKNAINKPTSTSFGTFNGISTLIPDPKDDNIIVNESSMLKVEHSKK